MASLSTPLYELTKKELQELEKLGSGVVFKYKPPKSTEFVALKYLPFIDGKVFDQEIDIMTSIHHPNLLRCHGYFTVDSCKEGIVMELCHGDLKELMKTHTMTMTGTKQILAQIAQGLNCLHDKKIIHRDLKPENVLIKSKVGPTSLDNLTLDEMEFKIGDFGFCHAVEKRQSQTMSTLGALKYMAPEIISISKWEEKSDGSGEHKISDKADIYSFGKIGLELINRIQEERPNDDEEPTIRQLLNTCCNENPLERPSTKESILCFKDGAKWLRHEEMKIGQSKVNLNLGDRDMNTIQANNNLAYNFFTLKMFDESRRLYEEILSKRKQLLGEDHLNTIQAKENLSATFHGLKMFDEARKLYEEVLNKRKQLQGEDHLNTIHTKHNLSLTFHELKMLDEARKLKEEVLSHRLQFLGEDHLDSIQAKYNLAVTFRELKMFNEAGKLYEEVVNKRKQLQGDDHLDTIQAKHELAVIFHMLKIFDEARSLYEEVLNQRKQLLGEDHHDTIRVENNLQILKGQYSSKKEKRKTSHIWDSPGYSSYTTFAK